MKAPTKAPPTTVKKLAAVAGARSSDSDPPDALFLLAAAEVAEATVLVTVVSSCPENEVASPASLPVSVIALPPALVTIVRKEPASAECSPSAHLP